MVVGPVGRYVEGARVLIENDVVVDADAEDESGLSVAAGEEALKSRRKKLRAKTMMGLGGVESR